MKRNLYQSRLSSYRIRCASELKGRILDCGSGVGDYLPYFDGEVVALDREWQALEINCCLLKVVGDARKLPFADNYFDSLWACAVVQYIDLNAFVAEAKRVVRTGGLIRILAPNSRSPWDYFKELFGMKTWSMQENIYKQYSVNELKEYGELRGEVRFLPFDSLFRHMPSLSHTVMLDIIPD